jgi:hypothetical protein
MIPNDPAYRHARRLCHPSLGLGYGLPPRSASASGPSVFSDFANGSFDASLYTFTRASSKTDLLPTSPSGYAYSTFANDVMAVTPGRGFLSESAATQLLNSPIAPATQTTSSLSVGTYTLWVNGAGSAALTAGTAVLTGAGTATNGTPVVFIITTAGTVTVTVSGALNAFQLELGSWGTSFITTKSTRVQDSLAPIGAAANVLAGASAGVVIDAEQTNATAGFACLLRVGNNVLGKNNYDSGVFGGNDQGGDGAFYAACGLGDLFSAKSAVTWYPSGRMICANGGICSISANTIKVINSTSYFIGRNGAGNWNGYIRSVAYYAQALTAPQMRGLTGTGLPSPDWVVLGDSLMMRGDGPSSGGLGRGKSIPQKIGAVLSKNVMNAGQGGDTATGALARYQACPELWSKPLILLIGWNEQSAWATVNARIADIVALNTSGKVVVLTVPNGSTAGEQVGGSRYTNISNINTSILATYATTYNLQLALVNGYNAGDAADTADFALGIMPASMRLIVTRTSTSSLTNVATTFNWGRAWTPNTLLKVESEYIEVTAVSGNAVTASTRAYGGGSGVAHASGVSYNEYDVIHMSDAGGRALAAAGVAGVITGNGW